MKEMMPWPSDSELYKIRKKVSEMAGTDNGAVQFVVSPYRICPLGAHIDHQGGNVSAMTINKGILLGFVPSKNSEVVIHSGQFEGEVRFRVDEIQQQRKTIETNNENQAKDCSRPQEQSCWGRYARGALYALQSKGFDLSQGIIGYICGCDALDSSGLSSSAAVGVAYLLALEHANGLTASPEDNIEYDRLIENEYLGLKNGIMDQSAILLSRHGCLMCMDCKTKNHRLINLPRLQENQDIEPQKAIKILLALSGLKHALTSNDGYNNRVAECQEAARILLQASGDVRKEAVLSDVKPEVYEAHKGKLPDYLAKRAEHYFSENKRVTEGVKAWDMGNLKEFGTLMSASGQSSIENYECGARPLIQLYKILLEAPGVLGARFSGAGFRGCCIALVKAEHAMEAASFVRREYLIKEPELAAHISDDSAVLICEFGDRAHLI